jgi:UDPglucose--hexose-1-phosphate uridylyltransferase
MARGQDAPGGRQRRARLFRDEPVALADAHAGDPLDGDLARVRLAQDGAALIGDPLRSDRLPVAAGSAAARPRAGSGRLAVVETWADRTAALSALPGVRQVYVFENGGPEIGVTLHHPHGQVYAHLYVTPRTGSLLASIASHGPGLMSDILQHEAKSERVLIAGEHFTAFVPFAARWPVEVHLLPHRHVPDLAETTDGERDEIAVLYRRIVRALDQLYDTPTPYIAAWHQAAM